MGRYAGILEGVSARLYMESNDVSWFLVLATLGR